MINGNLDDFLISGWYTESTLYLNGYTYWCEGTYSNEREKRFHFCVYKYKSVLHYGENGDVWTTRMVVNNDVVDYSIVFEDYDNDREDVKSRFLSAKIFDGKTFWEVEKEIAWYDED